MVAEKIGRGNELILSKISQGNELRKFLKKFAAWEIGRGK